MTAALGAAACVFLALAACCLGWNLRALTAEPPLQTRFPPAPTCVVYLGLTLAGLAVACLCLF